MSCRPRPEERATERSESRRRRGRGALLIAALLMFYAAPARSQDDKVLVQGLFDAEVWKTDSGSRLLSKNDGDTAPAGRLRLWAVGEFLPGLQGFVVARGEDGSGSYEGERQGRIEQAALRYTFRAPLRLVLEAGRIVTPLGNFPRRRLSTTNPLIGSPDSYDVSYPLGVQAGGQVSRFDYRVALLDLPLINEKYVPEPGTILRPALALGITPRTGLRLGGYATRGPYLNRDLDLFLPAGAGWRDFEQRIVGADIQFSRGYLELNGDFARSSYDVPAQARAVRGKAYFIEPKYTWTPRFFTALRLERNDLGKGHLGGVEFLMHKKAMEHFLDRQLQHGEIDTRNLHRAVAEISHVVVRADGETEGELGHVTEDACLIQSTRMPVVFTILPYLS